MGSLAVDPAGLGSPFHTPTTTRYYTTATPASGSVTTPAVAAVAADHASPTASTSVVRRLFRTPMVPSSVPLLGSHHSRKTSLSKSLSAQELQFFDADDNSGSGAKPAAETIPEAAPPMATFTDLPVELVQHIHSLADNPFLPVVNRYFYSTLTGASPTYVARHMLYQYRHCSHKEILTFALRRPIVTIAVLEEMVRIWDERREYKRRTARMRPTHVDGVPVTPRTTRPPLEVTDLPRRLFRHPPKPGQPTIDPMIPYLLNEYDPPINGHKGYALLKSVVNRNYDMVEFLLARGADPRFRGNKAVEAAIQIKDLRMVKLLVEPPTFAETPQGSGASAKQNRKRRRLSDRVDISQPLVALAMKQGTEEIVKYFVDEKGVVPPLNDIMAMNNLKNRF